MKVIKFDNEKEWKKAREMCITGSKLAGVVSARAYLKQDVQDKLDDLGIEYDKKMTKEELEELLPLDTKIEMKLEGDKTDTYYKLIAERIAVQPTSELAIDRGNRLEADAIRRFQEETGKEVDSSLQMWKREDNENIAISPDGAIKKGKKIVEAVEAKCLASYKFLRAWDEKDHPRVYKYQALQYFIVNDDLKKLHFAFYDDRMPIDFFYITIDRADVEDQIAEYHELEEQVLEKIKRVEEELTF